MVSILRLLKKRALSSKKDYRRSSLLLAERLESRVLLNVDLSLSALAPAVTVDALMTNDSTPELTGTVDDPDAFVQITVGRYSYIADNNGDGTWSLGDGSIRDALADGVYDVLATATNMDGNMGSDATADELTIDTIAPVVTVDTLVTGDSTPELSGTVDDPEAFVQITIGGYSYIADNNGDGTWSLADDSIRDALADGVYDVLATATDMTGNVGNDATIDELTISSGGDTEKPQVESVVINNGDAQRSMLTSMRIQFSEPVNLDELLLGGTISDHIKLFDKADPTTPLGGLDSSSFSWEAANNTLSIDFTVDGFGGSELTNLADGRYEVKFDTAAITDLSGNILLDDDGEDDGWLTIDHSSDSSTQDFYRLFGDSDGDGDVDRKDFRAFRKTFSMGRRAHPHYNSIFDANGDGRVRFDDLSEFKKNFRKKHR